MFTHTHTYVLLSESVTNLPIYPSILLADSVATDKAYQPLRISRTSLPTDLTTSVSLALFREDPEEPECGVRLGVEASLVEGFFFGIIRPRRFLPECSAFPGVIGFHQDFDMAWAQRKLRAEGSLFE